MGLIIQNHFLSMLVLMICVLLEVIGRLILPQKSHNLKWLNLPIGLIGAALVVLIHL